MDFYNELINLSDDKVESFVSDKIELLESEKRKKEERVTLGYHLDYNPMFHPFLTEDKNINLNFDVGCYYKGYISKGSKMVYGVVLSLDNRYAHNGGGYYYIDGDSYIYDFCRYVRDYEICNEYELFDCILNFLNDYYGHISDIGRDDMFKMIMVNNGRCFEPVNEHKLSDFKGRGNAFCSEYSVMAQNILCVFDIDSYLFIGKLKNDDEVENHAFNVVNFIEKNSDKEISAIVDFADYVNIYDFNFEKVGISPYVAKIDKFDDELLDGLLHRDFHLLYNDYDCMILGDNTLMIGYDSTRDYYIDNSIIFDKKCVRKNM